MRLDVAGNTQQADVVHIVCQPLHLLLSLGTLHGNDVVAIFPSGDVPFIKATLAESVGSPPYDALHLHPPLAVQQLLDRKSVV